MVNSPSLTVVLLTFNEERHIRRCLESLNVITSSIFIVDSFSTDRTVEIAESMGAIVKQRKWKNYADQFQWGIDNCGNETEWIMRMDADEYCDPELLQEISDTLGQVPDNIDGFYIRRKVFFYGKWIRFGGFYPHILLRIWRRGKGRIEQRWMDEHIVLSPGSKTLLLKGHLVDDNQKGITFWINKHNSYASREMVDLLNRKYGLIASDESLKKTDVTRNKWKRIIKDELYSKLPIGIRSTLYFIYRYFFRLGFLDGGKGFIWHFMQGYWYRMLVDIKIMEIEKRSNGNIEKICQLLFEEHGIKL